MTGLKLYCTADTHLTLVPIRPRWGAAPIPLYAYNGESWQEAQNNLEARQHCLSGAMQSHQLGNALNQHNRFFFFLWTTKIWSLSLVGNGSHCIYFIPSHVFLRRETSASFLISWLKIPLAWRQILIMLTVNKESQQPGPDQSQRVGVVGHERLFDDSSVLPPKDRKSVV